MKAPFDEMLRALVREEIRRLVREDALHELDDGDDVELRQLASERAARLRRARGGGR